MKEQQKKNIIDMMEADEELGLYDVFNHEKRRGVRDLIDSQKQTDENGKPITYWGGLAEPKQETLEDIKLEEVLGSSYCKYTVIENKLAIIYRNQEKILSAIKLLNNLKNKKMEKTALAEFIRQESKSANESVGIVKGAKWQQEKMYNEEEVKSLLDAIKYFIDRVENGTIRSKTTYKMYKEIFEQFKNK